MKQGKLLNNWKFKYYEYKFQDGWRDSARGTECSHVRICKNKIHHITISETKLYDSLQKQKICVLAKICAIIDTVL